MSFPGSIFSVWRLGLAPRRPLWLLRRLVPLLVALLPARPAAGATALEGLTIMEKGRCPAARAVEVALADMIPPEQHGALSGGVRVTLAATRDRYRVVVVTPEKRADKTYADPAGDCDKRARVAAVFVFLTVMPPEFWGEAIEQSAFPASNPRGASPDEPWGEPERQAPKIDDPAEGEPSLMRLELGGLFEAAPGWGAQPVAFSPGLELRSVLGRGPIAVVLSAGYAPEANLRVPGLGARLWRWPANVGVRWRAVRGDLRFGVEATAQAQLQGVEATYPLEAHGETVLRWGTRWGVTADASLGWVSPFIAVHATFLVDRRQLLVLPHGSVAELPRLWLGGSVGVAFEL